MNAAPSMLSTCGAKRSRHSGNRLLAAVHGVHRDAGHRGQAGQRGADRRRLIHQRAVRRTAARSRPAAAARGSRETSSPSSAPSSASRSADDVHDRAGRQRTIEAAAHAEIQRQVVALAAERLRAPRRRRHHADAGDEHVDVMTRAAIARRPRAAVAIATQPGRDWADLGRGRGDEKDAHATVSTCLFALSASQRKRLPKLAAGAREFLRRHDLQHVLMRRRAVGSRAGERDCPACVNSSMRGAWPKTSTT